MIFLDMDNTICESRQVISPQMKEALEKLGDIVVISGGTKERIEQQLDGLKCEILAQSGNETPYWYNKLTEGELKKIYAHINSLKNWWEPFSDKVELIQNRDCQVSLSLAGHDAPMDYKKRFDPERLFRRWLLMEYPFKEENLKCAIGGTSCLDYTKASKGENLKRYLKLKRLKAENCIYYGDSLFPGGNDESVIGVMPTIQVSNPQELLEKHLTNAS